MIITGFKNNMLKLERELRNSTSISTFGNKSQIYTFFKHICKNLTKNEKFWNFTALYFCIHISIFNYKNFLCNQEEDLANIRANILNSLKCFMRKGN